MHDLKTSINKPNKYSMYVKIHVSYVPQFLVPAIYRQNRNKLGRAQPNIKTMLEQDTRTGLKQVGSDRAGNITGRITCGPGTEQLGGNRNRVPVGFYFPITTRLLGCPVQQQPTHLLHYADKKNTQEGGTTSVVPRGIIKINTS